MSHALTMRARVCAIATAAVSASALLLAVAGAASAATLTAGTTTQLEEAVAQANSDCAENTIKVQGGAYLPAKTIALTDACGPQVIEGPTERPEALLDGGNVEPEHPELLAVGPGVNLTLRNVVVQHGGNGASAAVEDVGSLTLEGSSLVGNRASSLVVDAGATAVLRNSTLSDSVNGIINGGTATLENVTVAFNRILGSENHGVLNLVNTIIAENGSPNCEGVPPAINDHSLSSDSSCGAEVSGVSAALGPLFNDGGPTELHSLQPGSPAIDAGDTARCLLTDQEGQPRPDTPSTACDIGADEWNAVAPTINVPAELVTQATGPSGAAVTYSASATSSVARVRSFSCSPKSGSTFAIGESTVTCKATDGHGNTATASSKVIVKSTPPALHLPEDISAKAEGASGAKVSYTASATSADYAESELKVSCSPESGSTFAIGTTTVQCTAVDPSGNGTKGSFTVTVKPVELQFTEWILKGSLTDHRSGQTLLTLPSGSTFNGHATVPGALEGNTAVPAFKSTFKLFGVLPVTLGLTFTEASPVKGTIEPDPAHSGNERVKATATDTIGITSLSIFGLSVPTSCQTKEPVTFPLEASETLAQLETAGATFGGQTTLPSFTCSGRFVGNVYGAVFTALFSGPSNPFTLTIEP